MTSRWLAARLNARRIVPPSDGEAGEVLADLDMLLRTDALARGARHRRPRRIGRRTPAA